MDRISEVGDEEHEQRRGLLNWDVGAVWVNQGKQDSVNFCFPCCSYLENYHMIPSGRNYMTDLLEVF